MNKADLYSMISEWNVYLYNHDFVDADIYTEMTDKAINDFIEIFLRNRKTEDYRR